MSAGAGKNDRGAGAKTDVGDPKNRIEQWLRVHPTWVAIQLEGIDPPRLAATSPNVSILMVANMNKNKSGAEDFGFLLQSSRAGFKKRDRERECAKELVAVLDQMPTNKSEAWCQIAGEHSAQPAASEAEALQKLTEAVQKRCPKATVDLPPSSMHVLVSAMAFGPSDAMAKHGSEPELKVLERFDKGFGELFREARRVSGLVRQQWFLSEVWAKPDPADAGGKPFSLGVGMATDNALARKRAVHAAEGRAQILTAAMFGKTADKPPEAKK